MSFSTMFLELDWNDASFRVTLDFYPGYPDNFSGHPDNWYPGEGPEIEVQHVEKFDEDQEKWVDLDRVSVYELLDEDKFYAKLVEAAQEEARLTLSEQRYREEDYYE